MNRTSITSDQEKQYRRLVEDAANRGADLALKKVPLDKDGMQKLLGNSEFSTAIAEVIVAKSRELSVSNRFASEEVRSSYEYPKGYRVRSLLEQFQILSKAFPGAFHISTEVTHKLLKTELPEGAEERFAIPPWQKVASTYGEAVEKILAALKASRTLTNYREGQLGPEHLREHEHTVRMLAQISEQQKGNDFLIVPSQFGLRHRGRSVRRAREVFAGNEFGLGAFAVGCMLLTHPEREVQWEQLHIDCAGDEFSPGADGDFSRAPCFYFYDGGVGFGAYFVDCPGGFYGSASAFLPQ